MSQTAAASITARLDRLPSSRHVWKIVTLLSLGGCFEFYDLFFTAYVAPGLTAGGMFSATTVDLFGFSGFASFVEALFAGLFVGTLMFGFVADKFGRRAIFTLLPVVLHRRHGDHGLPVYGHLHRSLALHRRHRHRRGTGDHRHLCLRADSQASARPGVRLQPVHHLPGGAAGSLPVLRPSAHLTAGPGRLARITGCLLPITLTRRSCFQPGCAPAPWASSIPGAASVTFSGFIIAFFLRNGSVTGVFLFIAFCMAMVILLIGAFGPRTRNLALEEISH